MSKKLLAGHLNPANTVANGVKALKQHGKDLRDAFRQGDAEEALHVLLMLASDATTLAKQADELRRSIESTEKNLQTT